MEKSGPDYRTIYMDILSKKFPEKKEKYKALLHKDSLSTIDIIELNKKIFGLSDKAVEIFNQKHRSYNRNAIIQILEYQKKNKLNNTELARHFKLSRNTITKWKKYFCP